MDIQRRKKYLLFVDPESNCRIMDARSRVFHCLIEFNQPLVYQYHHPDAKDYLSMVGDADGNMHLYRHIKHVSSNIACYPQEEDDIDKLLETHYRAAKCFRSSETIFVNSQNGEIMEDESEDCFKIVRNSCEIKLSSNSHFQSRLNWQVSYSSFIAYAPLINQEERDPIPVYHTINRHEFYEFCRDFQLKDQRGTNWLEDVDWKLPYHKESLLQVFNTRVLGSKLILGEYQTLTVGVEKLSSKGDFITHLRNLRTISSHENIMGVIMGQTNGMFDSFAYPIMYGRSMQQYLSWGIGTNRTTSSWIKVVRGIIKGLHFLHTLKIRHGSLNLDNIFVKNNSTPQLWGLGHLEFLSDEVRNNMDDWEYFSDDIVDFGIVLLNLITQGLHGGQETWVKDDIPNLQNILNKFPAEDDELKDLLKQVLAQDYKNRPSLESILKHQMFCDWKSRVDLLTEVSDFCEHKKYQQRKYKVGRHKVVAMLDDVEGVNVFGKGGWREIFGNDDIIRETERNRNYKYDYHSLTDLLRIFRNIITHLTEFKAKYNQAFGVSKQDTETIFRRKFPKLFTCVRRVADLLLHEKFKYHFTLKDPDFHVQVTDIRRLENPYA